MIVDIKKDNIWGKILEAAEKQKNLDVEEGGQIIRKSWTKYDSNVADVQHVKMLELPDVKDLTPEQMKQIKKWIDENKDKIDKILSAIEG
jgi:hypothetical protein